MWRKARSPARRVKVEWSSQTTLKKTDAAGRKERRSRSTAARIMDEVHSRPAEVFARRKRVESTRFSRLGHRKPAPRLVRRARVQIATVDAGGLSAHGPAGQSCRRGNDHALCHRMYCGF